MKYKLFSFYLQSGDPKPLNIEVKSFLFELRNGKPSLVLPENTRDFEEEDYVEFDSIVAPLIGVSINDLLHGVYEVKTHEYSVTPGSTYLRVIQKVDKQSTTSVILFEIFQVEEAGIAVRYSDNSYVKESSRDRVRYIADILGMDKKALEQEIAKAGIILY
ncbi:hypothetical protein IG193_04235 [Infirmifilum lucidum]|uniref:Uncharacterized protein n=1 Tax=Infirmifilum lucidum TaxID=2776706 RepID=A0A7L9FIK2_9CREN|nr:hypothetical protein [Infirmifilum lucidum]QOJ79668.1 hypothetical protein IG193_04235 [Infirmifilum lucidum]